MTHFIGREDWLKRFQDYLQQQQGVIWRVTGQPGIGKSTLLRQFEYECEAVKRPNIWLDLEGFTPAQGLDVLAAMAGAARFFDTEKANKGWKEKVGEGYKTLSGGLIGALELGKDLIPGGGLTVGAAKVLVGLGEGVAGSAAQTSENAAAAHPELYLLDTLAKAGEQHPVCLVDTYEHILRHDLKVQSRLVLGYGQAREGSVKTLRLSAWLHEMFEYLQGKGWRIVMAGREVPRSKSDDQLPRFSRDEILQAARIRPALAEYLPAQKSAIVSVLSTLSFDGNPLWLHVAMNLLENLLAEGKDLAQLAQQPEYLHECFETDDPFDTGAYDGIEHGRCKLTLINTLTRHIGDLEDQAWKIALPRVLDKGIVMQLFAQQQANAILHNFKLAGVFRVAGQQFTLHEEIRDLLLAYARSKGWLYTDETRALHGKLWDYLNQTHSKEHENSLVFSAISYSRDIDSYPPVWMAEACYHRIMSGIGLLDKQIDPKIFWSELGGATNVSLLQKWQNAYDLPYMTQDRIEQLLKKQNEEKQRLYQLLDAKTVDALRQDLSNGVVTSPWDSDYWQQRVTNYGAVDDYFILHEIQKEPVEKIKIIDQMLAKHSDSLVPRVQEKCASALLYKGVMLSDKLDDPQNAVAVYSDLLQGYRTFSIPLLQELCAEAFFKKGWTQANKLNDYESSVATYDELLQCYGDSTTPSIQERCAAALYNKGWTQANKLDNAEDAISTYDELLGRCGDSPLLSIQEQCAVALCSKGWTQANKLNDTAGAILTYDALLKRFGNFTSPSIQEQCADALYSKGWTQANKLNDVAGAILTYDALLERFGNSTISFVQEQCAQALLDKGMTMENEEDPLLAFAIYNELLKRYPQDESSFFTSHIQKYRNEALFRLGRILRERLSKETGALEEAVDVYNGLLLHYHYPETLTGYARWQAELNNMMHSNPWHNQAPEIQEKCADALHNKGLTLEKLGDSSNLLEAVEVYTSLTKNFGDSTVPGVQELCAKALFNKGLVLGKLNNLTEAVDCYDDLLARYSQSENPAIQEKCQSTLANMAELLLVLGRHAVAIQRIRQVLEQTDASNQLFAIMRFLLWLVEADTALDDVLAAIRTLSPEVEFTWGWDEIRPLVDKLPEPRKTQAECFITFFEQHHNIAQLESCLANSTENRDMAFPPGEPYNQAHIHHPAEGKTCK